MRPFQTSDFVLASFAVYMGQELISVDRSDPNRASFLFQVDDAWPTYLAAFQAGRAAVEPGRFAICQKSVKSALLDGVLRRCKEQAAIGRALAGGEVNK
ncbi:MAG: hypothetical protein FJZ90_11015 [Chloroflexi bacterium]|nr:hypothetical protein [Chloroflexota bacterium]